jgi:hypothetical protein
MNRTFIDILAPGIEVVQTNRGSTVTTAPHPPGTSVSAPHVTGTIALLQEFASQQIMNVGAPRWKPSAGVGQPAPAQRHEVIKAVLMNSVDKFIDDGTVTVPGDGMPAPRGTFLGMERTVTKLPQQGNQSPTWFDSDAYDDDTITGSGFVPLDDEMGTGHLNAKRAAQQYAPGEFDAGGAAVPLIGWDYGQTTGEDNNQKYVFAQQLTAGSFISITLTWDRHVDFQNDTAPTGAFNTGDTFEPSMSPAHFPENDDQINDLDLYLLPQGAFNINAAVAASVSIVGTEEHIFFIIPQTDNYEFWVNQFDQEMFAVGQSYAVAWWFGTAPPLVVQGDYNGDQIVNAQDYDAWRTNFGSTNAMVDGNGNGVVDAADYVIWRKNTTVGSGSFTAVPEPSGLMLFGVASLFIYGVGQLRRAPA